MQECVIYARFSPRPNAAECDSIETQIKDLTAFAARQKWQVVAEFSDADQSGDDYHRQGLWDAMAKLNRGQILLVRDISRLARDEILGGMIAQHVKKKGARIVASQQGDTPETPSATFIRSIMFAFGAFQKAMIAAQVRAGMRRRQAEGDKMGGVAPYGYCLDPANPKRYIEAPEEQKLIRRIVAMSYVATTSTPARIARKLNQDGVKSRCGGRWHHTTIYNILRRAGRCEDTWNRAKKRRKAVDFASLLNR
jgi:DNA invertase Pin-like site-specific DNA recombinase